MKANHTNAPTYRAQTSQLVTQVTIDSKESPETIYMRIYARLQSLYGINGYTCDVTKRYGWLNKVYASALATLKFVVLRKISQSDITMEVPSYEEFKLLQAQVEQQGQLIERLLSMQPRWLDINQAAKALNCCRTTVYRLTKAGKLTPRYQGRKPLYELSQIRAYIQSTRVSSESADNRILSALKS